jgi:hypothetical protein
MALSWNNKNKLNLVQLKTKKPSPAKPNAWSFYLSCMRNIQLGYS